MALKDELIKLLPEFYRSSTVVTQFIEAVGEMFDGFGTAIDDFKTYQDYQTISEKNIENLAGQFDIQFLRNISIDRKREFVSEAVDLYRTNGTEKSLIRVFNLIGWNVQIDYCWIVDPSYYDTHADYTLVNDIGATTLLNKYDIIFGEEKLYGNDVFVDLFASSGNTFPKRPIYGESYEVYADPVRFMKVPYIKIIITAEDYDLFTKDYVDPSTGKVHSYTTQENYAILEDIREYFLGQSRPTHVAIYSIETPFSLDDTFVLVTTESLAMTHASTGALYDGTLVYGQYNIDRYISGEQMGGFEYGNTTMTYYGIGDPAPLESFDRLYDATVAGELPHILMRQNTTLTIDIPSDAIVNLMVTKSNGKIVSQGLHTWQLYVAMNGSTSGTPIGGNILTGGGFADEPISSYGDETLLEGNYKRFVIIMENWLAATLNIVTPASVGHIFMNVSYT